MIICIMSIVAAQTWLLQVCQLGLHLVQHTCVHHAEGKSNEFQCPLFRFTFCNFSFYFCFHFYPSLAENRREFTICIWLPEQRPHIWSGNICNKANNWLFCGLWERCEGNHCYQQKVQVSVSLFGCYCTLTVENITDKTDNWENSWHFWRGVKIRIRAFCCRQREQMTPKTPRTPEFVQINYSDFRGLQKTPLSGGKLPKIVSNLECLN